MKLFVSEGNPHCLKVLAALEETGVKCDVQFVNHEGTKTWLFQYLCKTRVGNYVISYLLRINLFLRLLCKNEANVSVVCVGAYHSCQCQSLMN